MTCRRVYWRTSLAGVLWLTEYCYPYITTIPVADLAQIVIYMYRQNLPPVPGLDPPGDAVDPPADVIDDVLSIAEQVLTEEEDMAPPDDGTEALVLLLPEDAEEEAPTRVSEGEELPPWSYDPWPMPN
jgi:hypothetical protein